MITQNYNLNLIPEYGSIPIVVHASQYDKDSRTLVFNLLNGDTVFTCPAGTTAVIEGTKPDGHGFQYEATVSGSTVTATTTQQMCAVAGTVRCELRLTSNDEELGTANFVLEVERAGLADDTVTSDTELPDVIALATEQMERAEQAANDAEAAQGKAEDAQEAAETAQGKAEDAADEAESWASHAPYIGQNGHWYVWDIETSAYVDTGVLATNQVGQTYTGSSTTAASTATKDVTTVNGNFALQYGATVAVSFSNVNMASGIQLNVDGTGAKTVLFRGNAIVPGDLDNASVYLFVYDGTNYALVNNGSGVGGTIETMTQEQYNLLTNAQKHDGRMRGISGGVGIPMTASATQYDNTTSGMTAANVQDAIDELKAGGGGTGNYNDLTNKPQIAGTTLSGNKSLADLGIASDSAMTGATSQANGTKGLVPAPLTSDKDKFLKGDGSWGTPSSGSSSASGISYSNSTSGLTATNVQDAIDEVKSDIPTNIPSTASQISYTNTSSGLSATNVQSAIDELGYRAIRTANENQTYQAQLNSLYSYINGLKDAERKRSVLIIGNVVARYSEKDSNGYYIYTVMQDTVGNFLPAFYAAYSSNSYYHFFRTEIVSGDLFGLRSIYNSTVTNSDSIILALA